MKTWIKRTLVGVAALVVVAVVAVFGLAMLGDRKLERRIEIAAVGVPLVADAASIERGDYLFRSRGCGDCHGTDGSGARRGRGRQEHAGPRPQPHRRSGQRGPRLQAGRLGARHPPRRQAGRPAGADHAERGLQPLHRRRPGGGRRLHPPAAAEGRAKARRSACRCRCGPSTAPACSRTRPRRSTIACRRRSRSPKA